MENTEFPVRRTLAAKRAYKKQAYLVLFLALVSLGGLPVSVIWAAPLWAFGIYLLRGEGLSPNKLEEARSLQDKAATNLQEKIEAAKMKLASASGGQAVVAYRNLLQLIRLSKSPDAAASMKTILEEINFDEAKIKSDLIGIIKASDVNKNSIEVYRDWIISGQEAYDIDASTRGEVHAGGTGQVSDEVGWRETSSVHFVSLEWAKSFEIDPFDLSQARLIVSRLAVVVDSLKPSGVSSADISTMINTILNNSGQPPAEKLQQLSELRYQRLLSDQEFEAAKAKVLGI